MNKAGGRGTGGSGGRGGRRGPGRNSRRGAAPRRYHGGEDLQPDGTLASRDGYAPQQRGLAGFANRIVEAANCVNPTGNIQAIQVPLGQNPNLRIRKSVLEEMAKARKLKEEKEKEEEEKRSRERERRFSCQLPSP